MTTPLTTSEQQERLIQQVIRYFDWEKVEKVMDVLDWKWVMPNRAGLHRPTRFQMQQAAYRYLQRAIEFGGAGSGGFKATYTVDEGGYECFGLVFEATGWEVDTDGLEDHEARDPNEIRF
jgi:hypothetical protein